MKFTPTTYRPARLPFGTRYHSQDVPCPACEDGTIVRHWAQLPDGSDAPGDTIAYPNTPCDQCGEVEAAP